MAGCAHTTWLRVRGTTLLELGRLQTLLGPDLLPDPTSQTPSLVALVGGTAMSYIPQMCTSGSRPSGIVNCADIHLHLMPSSSSTQSPILLADCGTLRVSTQHSSEPQSEPACHRTTHRPLSWLCDEGVALPQSTVIEEVFKHLIVPFADIICLFGQDLCGSKDLASWLSGVVGSVDTRRYHRFSGQRIIVLLNEQCAFHEMALSEGFPESLISALEVVYVSQLSTKPNPIEMALHNIGDIQSLRKSTRWLLTACELTRYHSYACDHLSRTYAEPFDFVRSTRLATPVPSSFAANAAMLLGRTVSIQREFVQILSSCIVLDSFQYSIHEFHPLVMYDILYREYCREAIRRVVTQPFKQRILLTRIRCTVADLTYHQETMRVHPATFHRDILKSYHGLFRRIWSNEVCLACIMRRPTMALSCGHAICEVCVRVLGEPVPGEPHIYAHPQCVLCYTSIVPPNIQLRPLPSTPRVLCVDMNGPALWDTLRLLEVSISHLMGFPFPIRECFDIVFGRGSGAEPVRDLFLHELSIWQCRAQCQSTISPRSTKPLRLARTKVCGHMGQPSAIDCYSVPGSSATVATITACTRSDIPVVYRAIQTMHRYLRRSSAMRLKRLKLPSEPALRCPVPLETGHTLHVALPSSNSLGGVGDLRILELSVASIHQVAGALVASHFYFELRGPPQYADGRYLCHGLILCRLRTTDQFWLLRALTLSSHRLYIGSVGYTLRMLSRGQRFSKDLTLTVGNARQPISILLGNPFSSDPAQCIGGSPFTIDALSHLQFT